MPAHKAKRNRKRLHCSILSLKERLHWVNHGQWVGFRILPRDKVPHRHGENAWSLRGASHTEYSLALPTEYILCD
jgi:hypothetical protein